MLMKIIYF